MASLKGSSGLTRDRFLSDFSRVVWVLSRTGVLTIDMKLKEMTDTSFQSSEQHIIIKQDRPSRLERNKHDMDILADFFSRRHLLEINALF